MTERAEESLAAAVLTMAAQLASVALFLAACLVWLCIGAGA